MDELTQFFTNFQYYINDIAESSVSQFNQTAITARELGERIATKTNEKARTKLEEVRMARLEVRPLHLRAAVQLFALAVRYRSEGENIDQMPWHPLDTQG